MKYILICIICLKCIMAYNYNPPCNICRWFIPDSTNQELSNFGFCKMFKENYIVNGTKISIYNFTKHCRSNESLCGKSGFLFDPISDDPEIEKEQLEISNLLDEYDEINNRLCGEVNEKNEIDEIETDFYNLFQRLKPLLEK